MPFAFARQIAITAPEPGPGGWKPHAQFQTRTPSVTLMECHYSVLAPGFSPHPPHSHVEEELLIILDGSADIVLARSEEDPSPTVVPMIVGQLSYYPAWRFHTLRNVSDRPVTYLMFKWTNPRLESTLRQARELIRPRWPVLPSGCFDGREALKAENAKAFATADLFDGRSRWLARLHCHVSRVKPGGGYPEHADDYDVGMVLLDGTIDLGQGRALERCGLAYFAAGEPHGMLNPGSTTASYLVFEFHK